MKKYKINLDKVWEHYPNPVTTVSGLNDYCVGGALCLYSRRYLHLMPPLNNLKFYDRYKFPLYEVLDDILDKLNPSLISCQCSFGYKIAKANDSGDFEKAKKLVKEALEYNPTGKV